MSKTPNSPTTPHRSDNPP